MKRIVFAMLFGAIASALTPFAVPAAHAASTAAPGRSADSATGLTQRIIAAGRIRLQAQRIAKLYQQTGMNLNTEAAGRQIAKARQQVDNDLAELAQTASTGGSDKARRPLERMSRVWNEMKRTADAPFSANNRNLINGQAEELSIAAGALSMQIEKTADTPSGRLLDLSLRQSMLAQRLARLYLQVQAGDRQQGVQVDMDQTQKEFASAMQELINARENSPSSRQALEMAKMQWFFFEQAIGNLREGFGGNAKDVATTSERILEVLDGVSVHYAQETSKGHSIEPLLANNRSNNPVSRQRN